MVKTDQTGQRDAKADLSHGWMKSQNCWICNTASHILNYMSHITKKWLLAYVKNKGADQLQSNFAADQRLCFRFIDSTIPVLLKPKISSP